MNSRDWLWVWLGILGLVIAVYLCPGTSRTVPVPAPEPATPSVSTAPLPVVPAEPTVLLDSARVGARFDNGKVTLIGMVPDEATRTRMVAEAGSVHGADRVVDHLTVDGKVSSLPWFGTTSALAPLRITGINVGRAEFNGNVLVLTGMVDTPLAKDEIGAAAKAQIGADVLIDNRLTVAAAPRQKAQIDKLLSGRTIEFNPGSAIITARGLKVLDELLPILQEHKNTRVEVGGHTDNSGNEADNQRLSDARSAAVVDHLVRQGVARERLTPRGYGSSKPIAENVTEADRSRNRRIEFNVREGED